MTDQVLEGAARPRWELEELMALEVHLGVTVGIDDLGLGERVVSRQTVGIDDVALLLDGIAYTEMASADLPWIDMVRWTADFITAELRPYWTDEEWREYATR